MFSKSGSQVEKSGEALIWQTNRKAG